jgi:ATP-binding cassette subfamily B protein
MTFSPGQMDRFGTGSLVTRVTNDITQVQNYVSQFVRGMIRQTMLTFGSLYFMFRLNINFGFVILCALPFIVCCLAICIKKTNPLFFRLQAQLDDMNSIMQEDVSGIRIIKACVHEAYEKVRFGKANGELIKTQLKILVIFSFMNPVVNAVMYIATVAVLLVGSHEVGSGSATPGTVMAAITYTTQLMQGILMLAMLFQNISRGHASWQRVKEILDTKQEMKDGSFDEKVSRGKIEFKDVSFAYPGSSQVVLKNINLSIDAGETVAVMGATGCGKTSLVNLIPRYYDVTEGAVYVDGIDVREYRKKQLREEIAVALQKSELFTETIEENIRWGRHKAEDKEIRAAAVVAQADGFIEQTKDKYQTAVAERGMSLSGGQKQRISIARAIVKNAKILIFDDATSALDLKTEADFYRALNEKQPDSTKIIVAQRIASVRKADRIVVLNHGTVEAFGTHDELLKSCRTYRDIYESQIGEEDGLDGS